MLVACVVMFVGDFVNVDNVPINSVYLHIFNRLIVYIDILIFNIIFI